MATTSLQSTSPVTLLMRRNTTAPGGDMDATQLSCNSCHDNHGKLRRLSTGAIATTGAPIIGSGSYTNSTLPAAGQAVGMFRLLRGPGSTAGSGGKTFTAVFNASVASTYNRTEAVISDGRGLWRRHLRLVRNLPS